MERRKLHEYVHTSLETRFGCSRWEGLTNFESRGDALASLDCDASVSVGRNLHPKVPGGDGGECAEVEGDRGEEAVVEGRGHNDTVVVLGPLHREVVLGAQKYKHDRGHQNLQAEGVRQERFMVTDCCRATNFR